MVREGIVTIDIETELIPPEGPQGLKKIFCMGVKVDNNPAKMFTYLYHPDSDGNLEAGLRYINEHKECVGHNIINFDLPVIERLIGKITIPVHDTLLLAKLCYTKDQLMNMDIGIEDMPKNMWGRYALKAFGYRFGDNKIEFEQFDKLTSEMITYCKQDTNLTYRLFMHLISCGSLPIDKVINLEYDVADIIREQERYGFYFDKEAGRELSTKLKFRKMTYEHNLKRLFKPKFLADGPVKSTLKKFTRREYTPNKNYKFKSRVPYRFIHQLPRLKNGKYRFPGKTKFKWYTVPHRVYLKEQFGEFQPIKYTVFNPGSRAQIRLWLEKDYNLKFKTFTEAGSRKVNGDELGILGEDGKTMMDYLKTVKDISEVVGVLEHVKEHSNSVHGRVDTIGAATHRCTHSSPNVAQTSASKEFRSLYTVPEGYKLVGADLANIEVRILAHYLYPYDSGKYTEAVLSKDMHWYHAGLAGFIDQSLPENKEYDEHNKTHKAARNKSKGFFFG